MALPWILPRPSRLPGSSNAVVSWITSTWSRRRHLSAVLRTCGAVARSNVTSLLLRKRYRASSCPSEAIASGKLKSGSRESTSPIRTSRSLRRLSPNWAPRYSLWISVAVTPHADHATPQCAKENCVGSLAGVGRLRRETPIHRRHRRVLPPYRLYRSVARTGAREEVSQRIRSAQPQDREVANDGSRMTGVPQLPRPVAALFSSDIAARRRRLCRAP